MLELSAHWGMKMNSTRKRELDLIKFVACVMVVILHAITPSDGLAQESVYLLGSFGIPLFFMVNGYLRADKDFSFKFVFTIIFRYFRFIAIWALIVGCAKLVVSGKVEFLSLLAGGVTGNHILFHFWFLTGLCMIYLILAIVNSITKQRGKTVNELIRNNKYLPYVTVILMTAVFIVNLVMRHFIDLEIRDVIYPPLRVITNGGYFLIGMMMSGNKNLRLNGKININWSIPIIAACFAITVAFSYLSGIQWASSYYDLILVTIGTVLIFLFLQNKFENKISDRLHKVLCTGTGVWILHPFVLKVFNKLYTMFLGEITLLPRCGILVLTIIACVCLTLIINKIKYVKLLLNP